MIYFVNDWLHSYGMQGFGLLFLPSDAFLTECGVVSIIVFFANVEVHVFLLVIL